jgi:hypothetical protein
MELRRRRVPRQPAGWFGTCTVEGDTDPSSFECRVIDVSTIGAGVEILGVVGRNLVGERLVVEVQALTRATFSVRFVGQVKNAGRVSHGGVRLGMEFVGLSRTERSILTVFEQTGVGW